MANNFRSIDHYNALELLKELEKEESKNEKLRIENEVLKERLNKVTDIVAGAKEGTLAHDAWTYLRSLGY